MEKIRFAESVGFLIASGYSIGIDQDAGSGLLVEARFDRADKFMCKLQVRLDEGQPNNLTVHAAVEVASDAREFFDWPEIDTGSYDRLPRGPVLTDTPSELRELKYGRFIFAAWMHLFGQALGYVLIRRGAYSLEADLEYFVPAMQETWNYLARNLYHDPEALG